MGALEQALVRKEGMVKDAMNKEVTNKGDAALTLTVADILKGYIYGVVTAARNYTTPTAALIIAAMGDEWEIGDTLEFKIVATGGAVTIVGGAGVTVRGGLQVDGVGATGVFTKTAAATCNLDMF